MTLILHGGGLVSGVLVAEAVNRTRARDVKVVTVHDTFETGEGSAARDLCRYYGVRQYRLSPPAGKTLIGGFRNGIRAAMATALAEKIGVREVWIGTVARRAPDAADARPEFWDGAAYLADQGTAGAVRFDFPFAALTVGDVAELARQLEVPVALTWSCEGDADAQCGCCTGCVRRRAALTWASVTDETPYLIAPPLPEVGE